MHSVFENSSPVNDGGVRKSTAILESLMAWSEQHCEGIQQRINRTNHILVVVFSINLVEMHAFLSSLAWRMLLEVMETYINLLEFGE